MFLSYEYGISRDEDDDWFDPNLSDDTKLFIDPFLIFETDIVLFRGAREKFIYFFEQAFKIAAETKGSKKHPAYGSLLNILTFPEVPELCLGYSQGSISGSGTGGGFAKIFADAILDAIALGRRNLTHFEELQIFTSGIGKDRISDVTANILKEELIQYTKEVCEKHKIPLKPCHVKNAKFNNKHFFWRSASYSLPRNPFKKGKGVILVPETFLGSNQAISTEGFVDYIWENKNEEVRRALNYFLSEGIKNALDEKQHEDINKSHLNVKSNSIYIARTHPEWVDDFVDYVENEAEIKPYNLEEDVRGLYKPKKEFLRAFQIRPQILWPQIH